MNKIVIDYQENIIRTAVMEEGRLVELIIDKKENESLVGNIYAGIVRNILPSQFAFIDIGEEKNGFLFLNDIKESLLYSTENKKLLIKNGDTLLVQVVKDETGQKGPYVTTQISFSGRLCVLIKAHQDIVGVAISKKITDENERKRLKAIASNLLPKGYELIIRTNCEGKDIVDIQSEIYGLLQKSQKVIDHWQYLKAPCIFDKQENPILKNIRDLFNEDTEEIIINNKTEFENIKENVQNYFKDALNRIKCYNDVSNTIFNNYSIESQMDKMLNKKVWLKSGGFLIIEQTEACVVIDVNSGKFSGKKDHEQSSLKLNIDACKEIARQMRLRNLCGIIIIDFIDMKLDTNKDQLTKTFSDELKNDRISTNLVGLTNLGLMEVTRKKMREPLINILKDECTVCGATGRVYNSNFTKICKKIKKMNYIVATVQRNRFFASHAKGIKKYFYRLVKSVFSYKLLRGNKMIALSIPPSEIKDLMNKLLKEETFDSFEVRKVHINSFVRFEINGSLDIENISDDEVTQKNKNHCSWKELRPYIFNIIKGSNRPRSMKFVFSIPYESMIQLTSLASVLFLNITFENNNILITTGVTKKEFSLEKSLDYFWDDYVKRFFKDNNIVFEDMT